MTSLRWGAGEYYPCVPQLAEAMGSEINAVALQAFMCGIVGMAFAVASVIWEMERWSIAKQTGIFFAVTAAVMMLFVLLCYSCQIYIKIHFAFLLF